MFSRYIFFSFVSVCLLAFSGCSLMPTDSSNADGSSELSAENSVQTETAEEREMELLNSLKEASQSKDWEQVIKTANRVLLDNPKNTGVRNYLGWAYAETGQWAKAIPELKQVIAVEPKNENAFSTLAWAYAGNKEWEPSIKAANQVIALNPENVHAYTNLAWAYSGKGDVKASVKAYRKAIDLKPKEASIYYSLANVYCDAGELKNARIVQKVLVKLSADLGEKLEIRLAKGCRKEG